MYHCCHGDKLGSGAPNETMTVVTVGLAPATLTQQMKMQSCLRLYTCIGIAIHVVQLLQPNHPHNNGEEIMQGP
jgi:hypothetical protein